jgi:hypothetical protein
MRISALIRFFLVVGVFIPAITHAQSRSEMTQQRWLEDLNYATKTLIANHPDIYYRISKDDFERKVARAEQMIKNSRSDEECYTAIRQVVASVRDGHTVLGVNTLPGSFDIFPVRLYEFSDGIYITGIAEEFRKYIGAKVKEIGQFTAEEAFDRAGTLAYADNDFYKKEQTPLVVITCRLAYGLGITETVDKLRLVVETENGKRIETVLSPITPPGANNMLRGMDIGPAGVSFASAFTDTGKELPLYLKHLDGNHNYWFEHDKEHRAIYMQFNLVNNQQDESFNEFYHRMFEYIDDNAGDIDKFVLDLRFNDGGNGPILLPFMNEIIKRDNINQLGRLYTLVGRRSFSASVLLVAEMMSHTEALLVGEPTGAAQNMFSDMTLGGTLPNSGVTLFLSSEIFNIAWPGNEFYMMAPHYPAPFSSSDFFSGKDPALEAIYADKVKAVSAVLYNEGPKAALEYFNEIKYSWGSHADEPCVTPSTFPISAKYNGEGTFNNLGYDFMRQNKLEEAHATFELNALMFPYSSNAWDSYAESVMKSGDNANAIKYYKKSLELNPQNQNAVEMLKQLEGKI